MTQPRDCPLSTNDSWPNPRSKILLFRQGRSHSHDSDTQGHNARKKRVSPSAHPSNSSPFHSMLSTVPPPSHISDHPQPRGNHPSSQTSNPNISSKIFLLQPLFFQDTPSPFSVLLFSYSLHGISSLIMLRCVSIMFECLLMNCKCIDCQSFGDYYLKI